MKALHVSSQIALDDYAYVCNYIILQLLTNVITFMNNMPTSSQCNKYTVQ